MTLVRVLFGMVLAGAAAAAGAPPAADRGSTPPGESRDESRPPDGAIRGGSIAPDVPTQREFERYVARCDQLTGELRTQCLRDLGAARPSAGKESPQNLPRGAPLPPR